MHVRAHIRYAGTDTALVVKAGSLAAMKSGFEKAHKAQFGFIDRKKDLVIEAVSVEAVGGGAKFSGEEGQDHARDAPRACAAHEILLRRQMARRDRLHPRPALRPATRSRVRRSSSSRTRPSWSSPAGRPRSRRRTIWCSTRVVKLKRATAIGTKADPIMLEVFNNLFMSIAEQMGVALQNTAYSVNIKERLDFSCAVFAHDGTLVANAPHMPVHLGSMDRSVETIIRDNAGRIKPGDVYVINAPYNGGTHLPDITVCTPVFDDKKKSILFWVASRGHHADVGGISPGSMSPNATTIHEEGVLFDNFKVIDRGRFREKELYAALNGAKYPARNPLQNVNDMKAQIAANEKGVQELRKMVTHFTLPVVKPTCSTCRTTRPRACAA